MEIQSGNRGASPNISKRKRACQIEDFVSLGQTIHFASTFLLRDSILCDTANICRMCISLYTHYTHYIYIYTVYYTITYTYRQPYPVVADSISFPKTVPMAVWGLQALAEGLPSSGHLGSNFGQAWAGCAQDLTSCCWEWFFTWVFFKPRGLVDAYSLSHRIHGAGIYANIKGVFVDGIHVTKQITAPWIRHGLY